MPEPTPPTGRTSDHASKLDSSHGGEHGRRWRLSVEIPAHDEATAHKRAEDIADHMAAEHGTRNPIVTPADGEQRDRIAVAARTAFRRWINLDGPAHEVGEHFADAVVAALPELAELDRLCAEVIRLTNRLTALESANGELLARAETAERKVDHHNEVANTALRAWEAMKADAERECQRAEQAEAERDTAQAAITDALVVITGDQVGNPVLPDVRAQVIARLEAALTPPSERCTCGQTACESELCDCDATPCPVNHRAEETDHG